MAANTRPLGVAQEQLEQLAEIFTPADGLDYVTPPSRLAPPALAEAQNYRIEDGCYRPREGTTYIGTAAVGTVMATILFSRPNGLENLYRFTTLNGRYWDGLAWQAMCTFSGDDTQYFTWTGFGDVLLIANGKDGIYSIDPTTNTAVSIGAAPVAPKFITTFGGRVIASNISSHPTRIQWSVKNSSTDWSGTGSGFDDLISTPGGTIDDTYGIYPINDTQALVVRQNSIWLMSMSGDANAPFRFSQLYSDLGTNTPYTVSSVPGGIVGLFKDNVYFINEAGFQAIGDRIKSRFAGNKVSGAGSASNNKPVGAYDAELREYRLLVDIVGYGQQIFRYSFLYQKWMRDTYPLHIRHIASLHKAPVSMLPQGRLLMSGNSYAFYENGSSLNDVSGGGGQVDSTTELRTGVLRASDPYHMTRLTKVFVEYDSPFNSIFMTVDRSDNGGVNWTTYGPLNLLSAVGSRLASMEGGYEHRTMQIRLTTPSLASFKLIGGLVRLVAGNEEPR